MFSVVIPLYNKEKYIAKTIQSVLDQSFTNFEIIIVNDSSTDNSISIVNSFSDNRIKIINQPNSGVSIARNNGVRKAMYNYIAFLDADDWWDSAFLEKMAETIKKFPDAAVYGNRFWIVKNGKKLLSNIGLENSFESGYINYITTYSKTFNTPFNCSFVVVEKQTFLVENGFKPELRFGEDFDLWIRLSLKYKIAYLNKPLSFSNQDVAISERALGQKKIYPKKSYFIFNLEYLHAEAENNSDLKFLLEGLYLRSLLRYHISGTYTQEVTKIISSITWSNHNSCYYRMYNSPVQLVRAYFKMKSLGFKLKNRLLKN